jgi:hypothetical protein
MFVSLFFPYPRKFIYPYDPHSEYYSVDHDGECVGMIELRPFIGMRFDDGKRCDPENIHQMDQQYSGRNEKKFINYFPGKSYYKNAEQREQRNPIATVS